MQTPEIITINFEDILKKIKELAQAFSGSYPEPESGLFHIFAHMLKENYSGLNQIPFRNYVHFLNMLGCSLLPSRPASTYLTFYHNKKLEEPLFIPAGTGAYVLSNHEGHQIHFETVEDLLVSPTCVNTVIGVNYYKDTIVEAPSNIINNENVVNNKPFFSPFECTEEVNLQEHILFIRHDDLFNISGSASIEVEPVSLFYGEGTIPLCQKLADPTLAEWSYSGGNNKWHSFDQVTNNKGAIVLKKTSHFRMDVENGSNFGRWIKCVIKDGQIKAFAGNIDNPLIKAIKLRSSNLDVSEEGGMRPDYVMSDDMQLDPNVFYPYGKFFTQDSFFYISNRDAFSKKNGSVKIKFALTYTSHRLKPQEEPDIKWKLIMKETSIPKKKEDHVVTITGVLWEYWNGEGWVRLFCGDLYQRVFNYIENTETEEKQIEMEFRCPDDLHETTVNALNNYWIRARITSIENLHAHNPIFMSPQIKNITINYELGEETVLPMEVRTVNNLETAIITECDFPGNTAPGQQMWEAERVPIQNPDQPHQVGGHCLFNVIPGKLGATISSKTHLSSYPGQPVNCWGNSEAVPQIPERGTALFIGFDRPFWKGPVTLFFSLEQHNNNSDEHEEIIEWQYLKKTEKHSYWEYLSVIDGTGGLNKSGNIRFEGSIDISCEELFGKKMYWIRAFILNERLKGLRIKKILMNTIPALQQKSVIGELGNIESMQTFHLNGLFPNEISVFNPISASGGSDAEEVSDILEKGGYLFTHRNRAVIAKDFERITEGISRDVSRVRCLENTNELLHQQMGSVAVVVYMGREKEKGLFLELQEQLTKQLTTMVPAHLSVPGKVNVVEANIIEVSVFAILAVRSLKKAEEVKRQAIQAIDAFLHPLEGNFNGRGWEIGDRIHPSIINAVLKKIKDVAGVESMFITVLNKVNGSIVESDNAGFTGLPYGIISSGTHTFRFTRKG